MKLLRRFKTVLALFFFCAASTAYAGPRTVFIQMFEWSWTDIARECEVYLGPAGFSAVQVSPPHEHLDWEEGKPWWERYQVVSYNLNSRSGNEAQFSDMVQRCKKAGVDIYADVVINHMAGMNSGVGFAGTTFKEYEHPGLYSYNDFHHCNRNGNDHIKNYADRLEVQTCELLDLDDLNTSSPYVQGKLADYLNHLLDLGVAGFRVDAAKHIAAADLAGIYKRLKRSPYIFHEIIYDPSGPIQYDEYTPLGDVIAYDMPAYVAHIFKNNLAGEIPNIASNYPRSEKSIASLTNHDLERHAIGKVLSYNGDQSQLYRLAQVFLLAFPYGYPQLYSGYQFSNYDDGPPLTADKFSMPVFDQNGNCQAPWTCEHRLSEVAAMVQFRNLTDKAFHLSNWWTNNQNQFAFSRGDVGFVVVNYGTDGLNQELQTSLPAGVYCNIVGENYRPSQRTCGQTIEVTAQGKILAQMPPMTAIVLLNSPASKLK